jgi:LPXTG-motif cell wall-anchored protein
MRALLRIAAALCLALVIALPAAAAVDEDVVLSARLSRQRVSLDEPIELRVEVVWSGAGRQFRFGEPRLGATESFTQVAAVTTGNRRWEEDGLVKTRMSWSFRLTPLVEGKLSVPPVTLTYRSREAGEEPGDWGAEQMLITPALPVEVTAAAAGGASSRSWLVWAGAGGILLAVLAAGGWLLRRRRRTTDEPPPAAGPWQELEQRLEELSSLLVMGEHKKFVTAVDALVREAMRLGLELHTGGMEGAAALDRLQERSDDPELIRAARTVLELSDLVKFAGHTPRTEEIDAVRKGVAVIFQRLRPKEGEG